VADRVALLAGDGTWQRDLAQSLIVREEDAARRREAVGPLASLATANPRPETRLHALWALEGLESLDDGLLVAALGDADPRVREQAVLLAERRSTPAVVAAAVELAADADPQVVLQVALSCGEWREPAAAEALLAIAARHAGDPLVRSAVGTSALAHFPAFGAGVARGDARLRDAYQGQVVRMTAGRRDREALAGLIAAAVDRGPADGPAAIESLLDAMQPLGFDPWTLAENGDGPEPPLAAALGRLDHALSALEGIATDDARADDARFTAARVLSKASRTRGRGLELLSGRLGPRVDPAVQLAALDAIGKSGAAEAPSVLAAAWPGLGPVARGRAIDVWLSRPAWTIDLLDRIAAREILAGSLALQQRDRLLSHPDKAIARRAAGELAGGATSARQDVVARYAGALAGAGDAGRGREVYRRACAACHRRADDGREVGPDLATVVGHAPERLLANILDPNADIQPGYHASTCVLGSGEVVSGIVTAESGGSLTMKLADGSTRTIARAEIDELVTANRSLMPEGLETTVTVEEMRDLLVFLRTR
jgi:putative heme-binding domain-containing protein